MHELSHVLSVSDCNLLIKTCIETEFLLQHCTLEGEISNLKVYGFGKQVYFNLIDGQSSINCVIFNADKKNYLSKLKEGQKITAHGKIVVFQKKRNRQLSNYIFN